MDDLYIGGGVTIGIGGLITWYIKAKITAHIKFVEETKQRLEKSDRDNERQAEQINDIKDTINRIYAKIDKL